MNKIMKLAKSHQSQLLAALVAAAALVLLIGLTQCGAGDNTAAGTHGVDSATQASGNEQSTSAAEQTYATTSASSTASEDSSDRQTNVTVPETAPTNDSTAAAPARLLRALPIFISQTVMANHPPRPQIARTQRRRNTGLKTQNGYGSSIPKLGPSESRSTTPGSFRFATSAGPTSPVTPPSTARPTCLQVKGRGITAKSARCLSVTTKSSMPSMVITKPL